MSRNKSILVWTISVIIMLFVVVYQKMTGPTYPHKGSKSIYGLDIDYSLPRSNDGSYEVNVFVLDDSHSLSGYYKMRRFKSHDEWKETDMTRMGDTLSFIIPNQPTAGKVMYQIFLAKNDQEHIALTEDPVIIRYRDPVPDSIIFLHVVFIFIAITLSNRTAFEAIYHGGRTKLYIILTIISVVLGGFVFGPIMQKYAFGEYWTGWPFGHDLTDNKTAVALVFWLIALWAVIKNSTDKTWSVVAAAVLIIVYLIPHSLLGSELDYTQMDDHRIEEIVD